MATVHVKACGKCGLGYSLPLGSLAIQDVMVEGHRRQVARCTHCGGLSLLRWSGTVPPSPLEPLLEMLQKLAPEPAWATPPAEAQAEVQDEPSGGDQPEGETPWSGSRPWLD